MKTCLILSGGSVDLPTASVYLKKYAYELIIAVDGGMKAAKELKVTPHFCVGDFDTIDADTYDYFRKNPAVSFDIHPSQKDETDTELAILTALNEGAEEIHIFGATGTRLDHTIASIGLLSIPLANKVPCVIIDSHNRITMCDSRFELKKEEAFGKYLSLLPYTDEVTGITAEGVKYPLKDYIMKRGNSLGVSNEILSEKAVISLKSGILLLIQSSDKGGLS